MAEGSEYSTPPSGEERDSRRAKTREANEKYHHYWYKRKGPGVIVRNQLGGTRNSFEAEDAFYVTCDDVAHSLNKGKRWEKVENAESILYNQNSSGKTSLVKASIPSAGMFSWIKVTESAAVAMNGGGVQQIIEVDNDEISVKNAKSNRASLADLESKAGPGPQMRQTRRRPRTVKGSKKEEDEGAMSDPSDEVQHTRYSTVEIRNYKPKDVERAWRAYQPHFNNKWGWTRKPAADHLLEWYSEAQDALEDELDAYYEEQLDSEEPLRFPGQKEMVVEKAEPVFHEDEEKEDEFPLRETAKMRREMRGKNDKETQEYRARVIEIRPAFTASHHLEEIFINAKEWFDKNKNAPSLPVFPRTLIIHKTDSEAILGTKMNKCSFVAESNVPGEVNLYAAPRFCCNPGGPLQAPVEGWQSHARNGLEFVGVGESGPDVPSTSSIECPMCKGTEETVDSDAVVVQRPLLFSLNCGHVACHSCWLAQAKQNARARIPAIKCVNPHCDVSASVCEASAIFSDGTLGLFRDFWWDSLCDTEGAIPCYACPRLLIPLKSPNPLAAFCPCGARTCKKCGHRDHLPISCGIYERWANMCIREAIHDPKKPYVRNPVRHLTPTEKTFLKNCRSCGAEETVTWKNWCEKCCVQLNIRFEDPIDTHEKLAQVLEARAAMMNGEYRQARMDRRIFEKKKQLAMEKTIDEGVFLFELIAIRRILFCERALKKNPNKAGKVALNHKEDQLPRPLFIAMETGGDPEWKAEQLRTVIEEIRRAYAPYM